MSRMEARMLADGRRLHLHDGPIDLIIGAEGEREQAFAAAMARFETVLDELVGELPLLRQPVGPQPKGATARRMWRATLGLADLGFITPMAAVAGSVAEEVLQAMTSAATLSRAFVNNGGDIALHLAPGASYEVGLVGRPDLPSLFATARVAASDPVRGIATSGWRGRSFSLGIADAVTVLARTASMADAAATMIANAVDLPAHPAITRRPADSIDPDSDLGPRPVTTHVAPLSRTDAALALSKGEAQAQRFLAMGLIEGAALFLHPELRVTGNIPFPVTGPAAKELTCV